MNFKASLIKWSRILPTLKTRTGEITSIAIGIATFGALTNWKILNPLFVRWLYWGDPSTSYLGWQFFRKTPLFQFPIGASPNYGVGFASSIMYTDSVPLIAIPLKYVSFLLPNEFQYFGIWILAALILQSWFAWKIISRFISNTMLALFGVVLFTNAPILIYRMVHEGSGHIGFIGQFLILWSLHLYFERVTSIKRWLALLGISPLVCLGLVPMVFVVFLGWLLQRLIQNSISVLKRSLQVLAELLSGVAITIGVMWITGALMVSNPSDSGFGTYRTSLTSLFDPKVNNTFSFSKLLPDLGNLPGSEEGFAFLSITVITLLLISIPIVFKGNHPFLSQNNIGLILATIGMGVFSLSNRISVLQRELFVYPIPSQIRKLIDPFRSSGRFVWPLIYVLILFGLISLMTLIQNRKNLGYLVLVVLLSVQIFESIGIFNNVQQRFTEIKFAPQLTSPRWDELAQNYDHLVAVPPLNNDPGWFELALLANKWGLSTNTTYLARVNQLDFDMAKSKTQDDLDHFQFDPKTLYILTNYPPNPMNQTLLSTYGPPSLGQTKSFSLDGFTVIAP